MEGKDHAHLFVFSGNNKAMMTIYGFVFTLLIGTSESFKSFSHFSNHFSNYLNNL